MGPERAKILKSIAERLLAGDCCNREKPIKVGQTDLNKVDVTSIPAVWQTSRFGAVAVTGWKSRCLYLYERLLGTIPDDVGPTNSCQKLGQALMALVNESKPE